MAEGPTHLLEVCRQKLSEFLCNVEHKHLAWLREIEEEAMKMFDSNLSAEPELMPKTPSQKKYRRKKRSLSLKDENNELTRKRLSRRRSSLKPASSKQVSQRLRSKEGLEKPSDVHKGVDASFSTMRFHSKVEAEFSLPSEKVAKIPAILLVEERVSLTEISVDNHSGADLYLKRNRPEIIDQALEIISLSIDDQAPKKPKITELQPMSAALALVIPDTPEAKGTGEDRDAANFRIANTSTPKAAVNGEPGAESDVSAQGPEKELFQDLKDSTGTSTGSKSSRPSARRSQRGKSHKHRRTSLAEKYSLASKRESMIRKSISRAISKKKAARESSSASSHVSCHSSLEVFVDEDATSNVRPELEPNAESDKAPKHLQKTFIIPNEGSPVAEQSAQTEPLNGAEQQAERHLKKSGTSQSSGSKEQPQNAKPLEQPSSIRRQSYKQAVDELCNGQQLEDCDLSPSYGKTTSPASKTLASPSPANKVVRPFKHFLQTVQKNQLLVTPGSTGHSSVMKNLIKRNTPTRPDSKEKERQRLESLRKKQEAEQQRKQKVEEEKRRRLEEMKLKREERLRKALQARERVEQMEEEKKKRMEQKFSQSEEKTEKVREEKVVEEKMKKKIAKKTEVETRKQKVLQMEEDECKLQELLQKRREDEQQDKGRKIAELKKLAEQQQVEQAKERSHKQQEKGKALHLQMELAVVTEEEENQKKEEQSSEEQERQQPRENKTKPPESVAIVPSKWLNITVEKSPVSDSYQGPPLGSKEHRFPKVNPNNYGLDLNSDDSTDDESQPRKPIPVWATGAPLNQAVTYQYYNPPNIETLFGLIISPKLEDIFYKNKPRYFKRTSSAVWHSPPLPGTKSTLGLPYNLKKY
ncbi:inner centromere protein-like isoform X2 [Malaclemys terrapin pileata]|uniref:inner centromere protein-like isoform X2 n=1 Tax=Malaclemys terrapin pileata TaxID=2991368 RepID=UPI0023A8368A|nr:inner centromere protein-like isoform X2 [Malaclemys terrapin pileata]